MAEIVTEILIGGLVLVIAIWLIPHEIRIKRIAAELEKVDKDIGEIALIVAVGLVPHEVRINRITEELREVEAEVAEMKKQVLTTEQEDA